MKKLDKQFVSEIDQKLAQFDATHPKSSSQQAESDKYKRIYHLRDVPTEQPEKEDALWD